MKSDSLVYSNEGNDPLLLALFQDTPVCAGVSLDVDHRDEMFRHFYFNHGEDRSRALAMYFQSGLLLWTALRRVLAWRFGDPAGAGKLLDFASGYGRVTRFLVRDVPPERVWVSDLYTEGVRFQEATFGVHGLESTPRPEDFACAERFDAILVSSLFTHLPRETFEGWLERLFRLLAPGGLLAFSVHGEEILFPGRTMPPEGFLFEEVSESGSLARAQYGTAWVSEAFVRAALSRAAPGASVHRLPKGLANYQDLWLVVGEPGVDFSGLDLRAGPEGNVERCAFAPPDRLHATGWVVDRATGLPPREVYATVGGEVLDRCRELAPRPDVAPIFPNEEVRPLGWRLDGRLPPGTSRVAAELAVRVVDAHGRESNLLASPIESAILRTARLDVETALGWLKQTVADYEARLARERAENGALVEELRGRIAAMRASRFWKLRDRWFAVKRQLGWTEEE